MILPKGKILICKVLILKSKLDAKMNFFDPYKSS